MFIRNILDRKAAGEVGSNGQRKNRRTRAGRREAFRSELARRMRVEALEQRMMLAADIDLIGGQIVLTDSGSTINDVNMDFVAGTLQISDNSGLTGLGAWRRLSRATR